MESFMSQRQKLLREVRALRAEVAVVRREIAEKRVRSFYVENAGAKEEQRLWDHDAHWRLELEGMISGVERGLTPG